VATRFEAVESIGSVQPVDSIVQPMKKRRTPGEYAAI